MSKHTQEKWEVALDYLNGDHRRVIVNMGDVGGGFEANMKRARLIAAAPQMLEVLERVEREGCGIGTQQWGMVRAAIAAAKGDA